VKSKKNPFPRKDRVKEMYRRRFFDFNVPTHDDLITFMIAQFGKPDDLKGKRILVLYNIDILVALHIRYKIPKRMLTFYGAGDSWHPTIARVMGVKYIHKFDGRNIKKYDIIISNTPYVISGNMYAWRDELEQLFKRMKEGTRWQFMSATNGAMPTSKVAHLWPKLGWNALTTDIVGFHEIVRDKDEEFYPGLFSGIVPKVTIEVIPKTDDEKQKEIITVHGNPELVTVTTGYEDHVFPYGFYPTTSKDLIDTEIVNKFLNLPDKIICLKDRPTANSVYINRLLSRYSPIEDRKDRAGRKPRQPVVVIDGSLGNVGNEDGRWIEIEPYGSAVKIKNRVQYWGISRFVWFHIFQFNGFVDPQLFDQIPDLTNFKTEEECMKAAGLDAFEIKHVKAWAEKM